MRIWTFVVVCALALCSFGCAVTSEYMDIMAAPQAVAPDPASATVVFVRPTGYAGRQKNMILDQNGRFLGESWGKTYFGVRMPPGKYTFIAWSEGTPALEATVEAGKVYYVEIGVTIGGWAARARLFGVGPNRKNWAELPQWLGESKMLVPKEAAGAAHFTERAERVREVVQKGLGNWSEYDPEAREQRSITPADGVTGVVQPRLDD